MTCTARLPIPAHGAFRGVPNSAAFCCLPAGHPGAHFNPLVGEFSDIQAWRMSPEQAAATFSTQETGWQQQENQ